MASLKKARAKLAARFAGWKRQDRKAKKTHEKGHRKQARIHRRAIRKLKRLIKRLKARLVIDWNGLTPVKGRNLRKAIRYALAHYDVYLTSTTGGVHVPGSWHYSGKAVDIGASTTAAKIACQRGLYKKFGPRFFEELFGPANYPWVKSGQTITGLEGSALETSHDTHIHMTVLD